ncbi:hypothetical protein P153DRAFT_357068 [Dothidotthia symphoricarpi CBS 119687]|uniref:Uncharacterized protein n=1 Tax=Dothidotthia symphoricarpi CBS 119687 TaxID=1392245 RepID=A0A6A6ACJ8_9PLEO|nr:uncharacterized protein P153DRAFT_357068 [Dothidotthia symphoricarpi CBS 119687]KAF2129500.1 hypothetical protein P153DRAFT_357068 [Dothidotthia symphoricarpi CBS 119687]
MCGTDCFLMLLSVLFPPIGVWVKRGICGADSLINIALCCLGVLPGLLHAWYIILKHPETYEPQAYQQVPDGERGDGRTTYYVVTHEQPGRRGQPMHPTSYGTVGAQPSSGQFPGQQQGFVQQKQDKVRAKQDKKGAQLSNQGQGGQGSSSQPEGPPPSYAAAIKGDHKVQNP